MEGNMTDGFDENVPQKMPGTKSQRSPRRPWDVKPSTRTKVAHPQETEDVPVKPLKSIETKEDTKRRVKEILKELTDQPDRDKAAPSVIERPGAEPEIMTATDSSMLIEEESRDVLAEIDTLEAGLESTLAMQDQVEEELGRVREEYDELLNAKQELEARIETLRTIEELESNLKAAEEENRLAMERTGELEYRLQETEGKLETLREDLNAVTAKLNETTREKDKLSHDLERSMEEVELYQDEVRSLQEQNKNSQNTIGELKEERDGLNSQLQTLTEEKAEVDAALEKTEHELAEERQKTKYLETSVENYAVIKATLESDLNAARSALTGIRQRLNRANAKFRKNQEE